MTETDRLDGIRTAVEDMSQGRYGEAEATLTAILDEIPDQPDAYHMLGMLRFVTGHPDDAVKLISKAISLNGEDAAYHANLALVRQSLGRQTEAEDALRKAVQLAPQSINHHVTLGTFLLKQESYHEAADIFRKTLALDPVCFSAISGLATACEEMGQTEEAEAGYRKALETEEVPSLHFNLGNVLRDQHRADEALAAYDRAIELDPEFAEAHVHKAFTLMLKGDMLPAWEEYEWRWQIPAFASTGREFTAPVWTGDGLDGRTLLIETEQGFGDTLQFIRYAKLASETGGRIIVECRKAMRRLLESAAGINELALAGEPLPPYDVHVPLLSLPRIFQTSLGTVPAHTPYLFASEDDIARWRRQLAHEEAVKIGIVWRGTAEKRGNPTRACPLAHFQPLIDLPGVKLFSLQKEYGDDDLPLPDGIEDLSPHLADFADTAAAMRALDLVITIDSAAAHLAGALGQPTWVLLSTGSDWRWLMDREDSPWYPSIRLFRQTQPREWTDVLARVADAVEHEFLSESDT